MSKNNDMVMKYLHIKALEALSRAKASKSITGLGIRISLIGHKIVIDGIWTVVNEITLVSRPFVWINGMTELGDDYMILSKGIGNGPSMYQTDTNGKYSILNMVSDQEVDASMDLALKIAATERKEDILTISWRLRNEVARMIDVSKTGVIEHGGVICKLSTEERPSSRQAVSFVVDVKHDRSGRNIKKSFEMFTLKGDEWKCGNETIDFDKPNVEWIINDMMKKSLNRGSKIARGLIKK